MRAGNHKSLALVNTPTIRPHPCSAHRTPFSAPAAEYRPRNPQDALLRRLVREHLATFVAHPEAPRAAPLPRYVEDAFERYLACGDLRRPFVRSSESPHGALGCDASFRA